MEFEYVGARCHFEGCHLHDFMPVECEHCKKYFCSNHAHFTHHECTNPPKAPIIDLTPDSSSDNIHKRTMDAIQWQRRQSERKDSALPSRATISNTELSHSTTKQSTTASNRVLNKMPSHPLSDAAKARQCKVRLMKIKSKAANVTSIPPQRQVFLSVVLHPSTKFTVATDPTKNPAGFNRREHTLAFCADSSWPIGKLIDMLCRHCGLLNANSATIHDDERLHLYMVDTSRLPTVHQSSSSYVPSKRIDSNNLISSMLDDEILHQGDMVLLARGLFDDA